MATYFRDQVGKQIQVSEATAAKATIYVQVGTAEAQTITVSKAGGAFGATAGTTYAAVDATLAKLVLHASDIDTEGEVAFKCVGATDTQYVFGIQVVDHDVFDDVATLITNVAAILADTGTDGVAVSTAGADAVADEVLKELIADHKATAGSLAEFVNFIRQRAGAGKLLTDTSTDTVKTYDTDGSTVLKTQTKSTAGTETTWTPS